MVAMNINGNLSVESIMANWQKNGGDAVKLVSDNDGLWTIEEEDGDRFTFTAGQWTQSVSGKEDPKVSKDKLEKEKALNEEKIKQLEAKIETMTEQVRKEIADATEKIEEITQEQMDKVQTTVDRLLEQLENGDITQEEFQAKMLSGLTDSGVDALIAGQVCKITNANNNVSMIEKLAHEIGILVNKNCSIDKEIKVMEEKIACTPPPKCDPIGFELDGVKYEFFVDKDQNGLLSNSKEFLGAENGWDEMSGLDADGDGKVEQSEMSTLMVVVTGKDGVQTVVPASSLFTEEDSIDLVSYKTADSQSLDGTGITNDILGAKGDGTNSNDLVGTFGLTFKGRAVNTGYQTLDSVDWLNQNYNFSDNLIGTENSFVGAGHKMLIAELRTMVTDAMKQLGFSESAIAEMTALSRQYAADASKVIMLEADAKAKEEIAAREAAEAEGAEETPPTEEPEVGPEVEPEVDPEIDPEIDPETGLPRQK